MGPLEATRGGIGLHCGGPKQRALLAFLLLHANEAIARDRLIDAVWGDAPPARAANALQVHVHGLRNLLGRERLETHGNAYLLHVEPGELDVRHFEELLRQAGAADAPATTAALLRSALALWRGSALADLAETPFARLESERLEEARLAGQESLIEAELALGRHDRLVGELEALVAEHPYRERMRAQLMVALYRAGRQADALAAYQQARREFVDELGIEPSRELQDLERAILQHDPALTVEPAELRERRRLPAPATPLIGRQREIAEVCALVTGGTRLVTLTGPGGTGKTRLALQAAYDLAKHFSDGVVFVELAALRHADLVLAEIAATLEVADGRDPHAALTAHLRTRCELLVIDNFEQVDEAAPALTALLRAAPDVKMLVTSRHPLRVYGEHEFAVTPLALDEEAVPLFLERARAAGRSLRVSEDVREVCRQLDCLPLALELVAARARELTVAETRSLLDRRLELASGGPRDVSARQQTLRATIQWSYELLEAGEQRLFATLAVFAGGIAPDAAAAVCEADLRALAALVDKALLVRQGDRFAMLETIREYALERLEQELDADTLRRRHAEYFADLGTRAEPELQGTSAAAALERLAAEHDNLRAALDWLLEHEPDAAVRLVDALYLFWYVRGHYREGLRWYERTLSFATGDPSARAAVVKRGAALAFACREFPLARSLIGDALAFYRGMEDAPNTVRALTLLGLIAINDGQQDEAVALLEESTALARGAADENVLSFALSNLGYVALTTRDLDRAYTASREAVELQRARAPERRNLSELGTSLGNLGHAALLLGLTDEARAHLAESVSVRTEIRDALGLASAFTSLAAVAADQGAHARAARLLGVADAVLERTDAELEPIDAELFEQTAAATLAELGDEAFARERASGRTLGPEEAADVASQTRTVPS